MSVTVRAYTSTDAASAAAVWNQIVEDGVAFPQTEPLTALTGNEFFTSQSYTGVAVDPDTGVIAGLYILHPNNVGRCGHICNASYAVARTCRGQHIGEALVKDCLLQAKAHGFRILQFNAVVATNKPALALYHKLGFTPLGTIPQGFLMPDGHYEDIIPHFKAL